MHNKISSFFNTKLSVFLLGIITGGVCVGILNALNINPFFSSAMNMFGNAAYEQCLKTSGYFSLGDQLDRFTMDNIDSQSPVISDTIKRYTDQMNNIKKTCSVLDDPLPQDNAYWFIRKNHFKTTFNGGFSFKYE